MRSGLSAHREVIWFHVSGSADVCSSAIYIDRYTNSAREVETVMPCAQVHPPPSCALSVPYVDGRAYQEVRW